MDQLISYHQSTWDDARRIDHQRYETYKAIINIEDIQSKLGKNQLSREFIDSCIKENARLTRVKTILANMLKNIHSQCDPKKLKEEPMLHERIQVTCLECGFEYTY
jgi:hypothetical protein